MPQLTQPAFRWPSRRERVLDLVNRLKPDLDAIDLDEVDGEFYWRICRDDLIEALARVAAELAPNAAEGRTGIDQVYADLQYDTAERAEFFARTRPLRDALPTHVFARLAFSAPILDQRSPTDPRRAVSPVPISLRPTLVDFNESSTALVVGITSSVWTGADLEAELAWRRLALSKWFAVTPAERASVGIEFALVREQPTGRYGPSSGAHPVPFVEATLYYPVPPESVVGCAYDAVVRGQRRWHLELPGSETRQEKEVAVRTWAIALLMKEGLKFGAALRALEPVLGHLDISQEADRQARNRLVERVPEAEAYLRPR